MNAPNKNETPDFRKMVLSQVKYISDTLSSDAQRLSGVLPPANGVLMGAVTGLMSLASMIEMQPKLDLVNRQGPTATTLRRLARIHDLTLRTPLPNMGGVIASPIGYGIGSEETEDLIRSLAPWRRESASNPNKAPDYHVLLEKYSSYVANGVYNVFRPQLRDEAFLKGLPHGEPWPEDFDPRKVEPGIFLFPISHDKNRNGDTVLINLVFRDMGGSIRAVQLRPDSLSYYAPSVIVRVYDALENEVYTVGNDFLIHGQMEVSINNQFHDAGWDAKLYAGKCVTREQLIERIAAEFEAMPAYAFANDTIPYKFTQRRWHRNYHEGYEIHREYLPLPEGAEPGTAREVVETRHLVWQLALGNDYVISGEVGKDFIVHEGHDLTFTPRALGNILNSIRLERTKFAAEVAEWVKETNGGSGDLDDDD